MATSYTADELARLYLPGDRMLFSHSGHYAMTAEAASRMPGLVELDRERGAYRRVQIDPEYEWRTISEALAGSRSPSRPTGNRLR